MTQPDLVSKLREVIAKVKPLVEKATPMPWSTNSQFIPQASAKILVGSDRRSIAYVGMNPQSKEWETYAQDITNTLLIIAAVNAMGELESLLGREGQAAKSEFLRGLTAAADYVRQHDNLGNIAADEILGLVPPCGPSQPETAADDEWWKVEALDVIRHARVDGDVPTWDRWRSCIINGLLRAFNRGQDSMRTAQPSPSTPIVPGTAGLSAEQLQAADGLNAVLLGAAPPAERWTCPDCGYDSMPYPPKDYHICPKCMVEFGNDDRKSTLIEREARIRKDVLREAFLLRPGLPHEWNSTQFKEGYYSGLEAFRQAIEKALAERPAPAGEVPKGEK